MNNWLFNDETFNLAHYSDKYVGFVYLITNEVDGKYYIGQKKFYRTIKRPPLKGKTRKRISVVESNWQDYWGSSVNLTKDIEEMGVESFKRKILYLCETKSVMNYVELLYQVQTQSIFDKHSYNGIINVRIGKSAINSNPDAIDRLLKLQGTMK